MDPKNTGNIIEKEFGIKNSISQSVVIEVMSETVNLGFYVLKWPTVFIGHD